MCKIIGQQKLLNKLNTYTDTTLPKAMLFIGDYGCGKHTIAKYVAQNFNLDYVEINENVSAEDLIDYNYRPVNTLYVIDLTKFSEKQQNQFLKFIEEPSKSVYVILTANSENIVLNTILNRCLKFYFEDYSIEELKELTKSNPLKNELIYSVCKTPGKLKNISDKSFESLFEQSYRLVACVQEMTYPQILVYKELINLKEEYNKIDFVAFFDMVEYLAYENYKSNASEANFNIYKITNQYKQLVSTKTPSKFAFLINYLTVLWKGVH